MRPAELDRLTVVQAADRYVELVRAKTLTGALSQATAELYARDAATLVALAGESTVLDDLSGEDVDAILLAFARKPDGRRSEPVPGLQSAASQARFRRSVSALFKHAALAGWVQINPMTASTVTARERGGLRPEHRHLHQPGQVRRHELRRWECLYPDRHLSGRRVRGWQPGRLYCYRPMPRGWNLRTEHRNL